MRWNDRIPNAARLLAGWKEADEVMSNVLLRAIRGEETFKRFWCLVRRESCSPTVFIDMLKRFEDRKKHAALIQILHALLGEIGRRRVETSGDGRVLRSYAQ